MKILSLGLDKNLLRKKRTSSVVERQLEYAKPFDEWIILVQNSRAEEKEISNVRIIGVKNSFNYDFPFRLFFACFKSIRKFKPNLVIAQDPIFTGFPGYLTSKLLGVPFICNLHGDYLNNHHWISLSRLNFIYNRIGLFVLKRAKLVRTVSTDITNRLLKYNSNFVSIPTPVDFSKYYIHESQPHSTFTVLSVGSYVPEKNFKLIVELAERLPDINFRIAGQGKEFNSIQEEVKNRNLTNLKLLGAVEHSHIGQEFANCDMYLHPTLFDGLAKVIEEAAWYGKPIVASRVSGTGYIIEHKKSGYLFDVNDVEGAIKGIRFYQDKENREESIRLAKEKLKQIDHTGNFRRLQEIWKKIAKK